MRFLILAVVCFSLNITLYAQSFSMEGQFWASGLTGNDVPSGQSAFESSLGYIPTFSLSQDLSDFTFFDFEWACRLDRAYSGDSLVSNHEKNHRLWIRYSSEKVEVRLGLQKIIFGPSQILRTLSWFDTFDLTDPTGQTDGVDAFRLKWFPSNSLSIWSWAIQKAQDTLSFGGRAELSSSIGEFGFTFHVDPSKTPQQISQLGIMVPEPQQRFALDIRHDGFIGSWMESSFIVSENSDIKMTTIGADYTLPIANGLLIMTESMFIKNRNSDDQNFTAFMAILPLSMVHSTMFISQFDWQEDRVYSYFRWSVTYDKFSLNLLSSQSPKRVEHGLRTGIQFIFIYNY